jgi:hypothetical protein
MADGCTVIVWRLGMRRNAWRLSSASMAVLVNSRSCDKMFECYNIEHDNISTLICIEFVVSYNKAKEAMVIYQRKVLYRS